MKNGQEIATYGWPGVLTGAGVVFFAYIGFDMISTTAQECKNPGRDLPIGIFVSLVVCTLLYIVVALVMTGVVPFQKLGVADPIALGIDRIVEIYNWSPGAQKAITLLVKFGALAGLTSGLLVVILGQSRIFFAMARDGLLPWFGEVHEKYSTPHVATFVTALIISILAGILPISVVGELVSIGTLLAFIIVCIGIPVLRITSPEIPRPFKVPFYWFTAPLSAGICLWIMTGLPKDTWLRLIIWLAVGLFIYFAYGIRKSKVQVLSLQNSSLKVDPS
jgi:APA family basic amino acid/polyamine antiporter